MYLRWWKAIFLRGVLYLIGQKVSVCEDRSKSVGTKLEGKAPHRTFRTQCFVTVEFFLTLVKWRRSERMMEKKGALASQSTCLASHLLQTLPYVMLHRAALYEQKEIQTFSTVFVCIYVYMWMVLCVCLCGCVCVLENKAKHKDLYRAKRKL